MQELTGAGGNVLVKRGTLTQSQMRTLNTNPVELLPLRPGYLQVLFSFMLKINLTGIGFAMTFQITNQYCIATTSGYFTYCDLNGAMFVNEYRFMPAFLLTNGMSAYSSLNTSDNNLLMFADTPNDGSITLASDAEYTLFYGYTPQ